MFMNFRKVILQKFIDDKIQKIIWHCSEEFWILFFGLIFKLFILYWIFELLNYFLFRFSLYLWRALSAMVLFFLLKFVINFLNTYFESIVITSDGIYVFVREAFLEHRMDFFEWRHIQVVSNEQNDFWDKVFGKWDIKIIVMNGVEFRFNEVSNPNTIWNYITNMKEKCIAKQQITNEERQQKQEESNMNVLVNALGEVISEYVKK